MSLLQIDPSRTSTIRDSFERDFARRIARLTKSIKDLLQSKAFGKALVSNAFCPTGKGGGVDPTCGKRDLKSAAAEIRGMSDADFERLLKFKPSKPKVKPEIDNLKVFTGGSGKEGELVTYYTTSKGMAESYVDMYNERFGSGGKLHSKSITIVKAAPWSIVKKLADQLGMDTDSYTPASVFDYNLFEKAQVASLISALKSRGYDGSVLDDIAYGQQIQDKAYITFTGGLTKNAFCPTGEGGGIDNSCSPKKKNWTSVASRIKGLVWNAFGIVSEVKFHYDDSGKVYGEHGETAWVVNPDLGDRPHKGLNFTPAPDVTETSHLITHELIHKVYSTDIDLGEEIANRLSKIKASNGSAVSIYGAFAGKFENAIELGAAYVHSPEQLRSYSKEMYALADEWASRVQQIAINSGKYDPNDPVITNAFCPTGEGGGIDNSCSPKKGKLKDKTGKVVKVFHGTNQEFTEFKDEAIYFSPSPGYSYVWNSPHVIEAELEMKNPYYTDNQSDAEGIAYWPEFIAELKAKGHDGLIYSKKGDILKGASGWGNDYPQYVVFSSSQIKVTNRYKRDEFRQGIQYGEITANSRWAFEESQSKVDSFEQWLKAKLSEVLDEKDIHSGTDWWQIYIERAYKFGAARAFDQIHKKKATPTEGMLGAKQFFMGTVPKERLKLLIARTYKGIEGLTESMRNQLTQELTDGLLQGLSYTEVGKRINSRLGIGLNRAKTIARTEIVRAQAEGQLAALKALGIKQLGIEVEFHTAKKPCPKCRKYQGRILSVEEAEGLIPLHPNCKCAFTPFVNPSPSPQKTAKRKALEASILRSTVGKKK